MTSLLLCKVKVEAVASTGFSLTWALLKVRAAEQLCVTPNKIHPMSYIIKPMTKFKDNMGHSLCPILWPMSATGFVEMLSMDFYDLGHKMSKSLETWGLKAQVQALVTQSIPPAGVSLTSTMTHEQLLSACPVADPGLWPPYRVHNRLNNLNLKIESAWIYIYLYWQWFQWVHVCERCCS